MEGENLFENEYLFLKVNYSVVWTFRGTVFRELQKLYVQHACREYLENWPDLVKYCGYREDNIPQLQDLHVFLKSQFTKYTNSIDFRTLKSFQSEYILGDGISLGDSGAPRIFL